VKQEIVLLVIFIALTICISPLLSNQSFAQSMMSPRAQMQMNPDISQLSCRDGYVLLTKSNGMPSCVSTSSYLRLVDRGWGMWNSSIMMNRPQMMNNLMGQMMQDPQLMQQWHDVMIQNPQQLQETRNQWLGQIKENPQLLANIMGPMTTDPQLQTQMIDQMLQHQGMMQSIRNNTGWMGMMHGQMMGQGMGMHQCAWCQAASNPNVHYGTTTCPWCPVTNQTMGPSWMMHNPQYIQNMMGQVWQNSQWRQQMNDMMIQNPLHAGPMMNQMIGPMVDPMMSDPVIRQQMLDMIAQNQEFMQKLKENQKFQQGLNP
jgi:hypothetical protein